MPNDDDIIIGSEPAFLAALALARRVAPTRVPVLVQGESGTGKELVARLLHRHGPAPRGPLVAVNCGTLPRELADSELFGHERGAFTGAGARKVGWFEEANGGTLVLDEIGELPLELQPKLLRVLETGRLRRVGGAGEIAIDVRVVALTLRELRREVELRRFRLDLYHRLAGVEVVLPSLRQRRGDIRLLVAHFLDELAGELGRPAPQLEPEALEALVREEWPGNVRELRNVLRRAIIVAGARIGLGELALSAGLGCAAPAGPQPPRLADGEATRRWPAEPGGQRLDDLEAGGHTLCLTGQTFENIERAVLRWALAHHGGSRRRAARALGVPRSTFCDKVRRYEIGTTNGPR